MNNIDLIFSDKQYSLLNEAYSSQTKNISKACIEKLNTLLQSISTQDFRLPFKLRHNIYLKLSSAQQLLGLIYQSNNKTKQTIHNNPFCLIGYLCSLTLNLIHYEASPYQIINLKASKIILDCISDISNWTENQY